MIDWAWPTSDTTALSIVTLQICSVIQVTNEGVKHNFSPYWYLGYTISDCLISGLWAGASNSTIRVVHQFSAHVTDYLPTLHFMDVNGESIKSLSKVEINNTHSSTSSHPPSQSSHHRSLSDWTGVTSPSQLYDGYSPLPFCLEMVSRRIYLHNLSK